MSVMQRQVSGPEPGALKVQLPSFDLLTSFLLRYHNLQGQLMRTGGHEGDDIDNSDDDPPY
jgi:hypothetical protein